MDGKTVIITGSNTGIGKYTALELAKRGAKVILACRDRKRGEKALEDIKRITGNNQVELELVDLASLKSVRECAKRLRKRLDKLDVLINNAGVMMAKGKSDDGYEIHFAVNHLGHFLFTNLLLDLMKKSPSARIINVSSVNHYAVSSIKWDDINFEKPFWSMSAYSHSKLANILFTNELARRLKDRTNITVNSLHPGVCRTEVIRNILGPYHIVLKGILFLIMPIWWCLTKNLEQSAQTSIYLASDRHLEHVTGKYFRDCKEVLSSKMSRDEQAAQRLWTLSEQMTDLSNSLNEIQNK